MPSAWSMNEMENKYGDWNVSKIRVARRPLVNEFIGAKLLGMYAKRQNPAHDQVFHSYVEFALTHPETGEKRIVRVEKAQNVHSYEVPGGREELNTKYEQALQIEGISPAEPFWKYIERTRKLYAEKGLNFDEYDLAKNNCQYFAMNILDANGLYDEKKHSDFINQDASKIVPKIIGWYMKRMTDKMSAKEREASGPAVGNIHSLGVGHILRGDLEFGGGGSHHHIFRNHSFSSNRPIAILPTYGGGEIDYNFY